MKRKGNLLLIMAVLPALLLAACGASAPAPEELDAVLVPTAGEAYADYAGYQFSGQDPWGGTLTLTIIDICDGKMDWSLADSFEDHTLYQVQRETALENMTAAFDLQGKDVEGAELSFTFRGSLELGEETITLTFSPDSVIEASSQVEKALPDDSPVQAVLSRADGPYARYIVQAGDSLHSIAERLGMSTKELALLNQIVIVETARANGLEFEDATEYAKYLFPGEELLFPLKK